MRSKIKVILPLVILLFCISCSINDRSNGRYEVIGRWKLIDVSGGPNGNTNGIDDTQQLQINSDYTFSWYQSGSLWAHGKISFSVVDNAKVIRFAPVENVSIVQKKYFISEHSQLRLIDDCTDCYYYTFDPI